MISIIFSIMGRENIRLPTLERVWDTGDTKWKHVIEPHIVYRYVNGVNDFGRFLRFDDDDTLTIRTRWSTA